MVSPWTLCNDRRARAQGPGRRVTRYGGSISKMTMNPVILSV